MSKQTVRPATMEDAIHVATNLRDADRSELAGLGHTLFRSSWAIFSVMNR